MSRPRRSPLPRRAGSHGFVLIMLLALLAMGGLYFLVSNLTPEAVEARRQAKTDAALVEAREALIGYALRYREDQINDGQLDRVYGYLPLPDLGSSNNNNIDPKCKDASNNPLEGCDAASNTTNFTVIGRFPWRMLGTGPLRDGNGECLWYIVSGSHDRIQRPAPMNWDTLGHLDVVTTTDTEKLQSLIASPHDRPVAIIFSPGPPLAGQNRSNLGGNDVSQCGGNYIPTNYLEPNLAANLAGDTSTDTATTNLAIATQGRIVKEGATTLKKACATGTSCDIVANDIGLTITSEILFGAIRKSSSFRDKGINALLNRIGTCLRDPIEADTVTFATPTSSSADVTVGRVGDKPVSSTCDYGDSVDPFGYFSHYRDHFFLAKCNPTCNIQIDGAAPPTSCSGALIFANQRGIKSPAPTDAQESPIQLRTSGAVSVNNPTPNVNWLANYLEGDNLLSFNTLSTTFAGPSLFGIVKASRTNQRDIDRCLVAGTWTVSTECHSLEQDIVYCIPTGPSQITVGSPSLSSLAPGVTSLASYVPASQTLTLGVSDVEASSSNALANTLFGCSWAAEPHSRGNGFRSYFRFKILDTGDGFTFAIVDADRNTNIANRCGAARQHLGYSGNNSYTLPIEYPKIAIEFDTSRNSGFIETGNQLTNGRNDPDYTPPYNSDSHVAIMYWGHQAGTTAVTYPDRDDNVHSIPGSDDPVSRPAPRNATPVIPHPFPAPYPPLAISPEQRLRDTTLVNRDFHVRVEVTPQTRTATDESLKRRPWKIEAWIVPTASKVITNLAWAQDIDPITGLAKIPSSGTVTVTAPGHDLSTNDTVSIREAPSAFNGNFIVTASDQVAGTFKFAKFPDPGSTAFSGQPVAMKQTLQVSRMKATTDAMFSLSPVVKFNSCTSDVDCGSSQSCSGADSLGVRYCYAGHQPTVYDQQYIYDIANGDGTYQDALGSIRLGFTIGVGSSDQVIDISELFTTWLP